MIRYRIACLILILVSFKFPLFAAADQLPLTQDPLTKIALSPALIAFATIHQIPLNGISLAATDALPRKGDRTVFLLTLMKAGTSQQWLVQVERDDLTEKERARKSPDEDVIYTSTGREFHYKNSQTALHVKFFGPFNPETTPSPISTEATQTKQARTLVSSEYLALGMGEYCRSALQIIPRLKSAGVETPEYYGTWGSPPAAEALTRGRAAAAAIQLTEEDERLAFSVYFSLRTFFTAANKIAACQEVLEQVMIKPSVWSAVSHFGIQPNFQYGWQDVRRESNTHVEIDLPVYQIPLRLSLNGTLAFRSTLAVTTPRPPLETCAGILALCVEHPTDPDKRLFIRLLSARRTEP